tara:strand:+ start:1002 stop:1991 length:990 start_codon:yes stop_codon:yes gene_type:complete
MRSYKGYLIQAFEDKYVGSIEDINFPEIANDHVVISTEYSSLNYKDALSASGPKYGVTREYPFVPGIDAAGKVLESKSKKFNIGDEVIVTGYSMGMSVFGGFGEIVHVPETWVANLPSNLTLKESMNYGTAGLTAAASVKKIIDNGIDAEKPILVSGATGGVGSVAISILSKAGYDVHALTGKKNEDDFLKSIGAKDIISRDDFMNDPVRPLDKALYGGAVDTVGGDILAKIISKVAAKCSISACGNVAGMELNTSVFPFILRGVSLMGIDSAESSISFKQSIWELLANEWKVDLENYTKDIKLAEVDKEITKILNGDQVGRVVIKHGE